MESKLPRLKLKASHYESIAKMKQDLGIEELSEDEFQEIFGFKIEYSMYEQMVALQLFFRNPNRSVHSHMRAQAFKGSA